MQFPHLLLYYFSILGVLYNATLLGYFQPSRYFKKCIPSDVFYNSGFISLIFLSIVGLHSLQFRNFNLLSLKNTARYLNKILCTITIHPGSRIFNVSTVGPWLMRYPCIFSPYLCFDILGLFYEYIFLDVVSNFWTVGPKLIIELSMLCRQTLKHKKKFRNRHLSLDISIHSIFLVGISFVNTYLGIWCLVCTLPTYIIRISCGANPREAI